MSRFGKVLAQAAADGDPGAGAPRGAPPPPRFDAEMRVLKGQLQGLLEARRPAVIGVTACNLGEGATTVARELARSLAAEGFEVLLCGALEAPPRADASRRAFRTVVANLSFANISDLHRPTADRRTLLSFRSWLDGVRDGYEVVLLDTPPVLNQAGWEALYGAQDGLLLVVEAERTRQAVLKASLETISSGGGHVLGIVFNRRRRHIPEFVYQWL